MVDALASGVSVLWDVRVQVPPRAQIDILEFLFGILGGEVAEASQQLALCRNLLGWPKRWPLWQD